MQLKYSVFKLDALRMYSLSEYNISHLKISNENWDLEISFMVTTSENYKYLH